MLNGMRQLPAHHETRRNQGAQGSRRLPRISQAVVAPGTSPRMTARLRLAPPSNARVRVRLRHPLRDQVPAILDSARTKETSSNMKTDTTVHAREFLPAFVPTLQGALAVTALLFFALVYVLYDAIYSSVGLHPSDVGLGYFDVLARSSLAACITAATIAYLIRGALKKSFILSPTGMPGSSVAEQTLSQVGEPSATSATASPASPRARLRPWQVFAASALVGLAALAAIGLLLTIGYIGDRFVYPKVDKVTRSVAHEIWYSNVVLRQEDLEAGVPPTPISLGPFVILDLQASVVDLRSFNDASRSPVADARGIKNTMAQRREGMTGA